MRRVYLALFSLMGLIFTTTVFADSLDPLLNKVTLQLTAEQWVQTKTALLTVGVNASVSDIGLEKVQSEVLDKLNKLTNKGEWHIISFDRSQDASGLERVQMTAQIRIADSELSGLRDKAKSISKPGETYTIDNVQLIPSEDEMREARAALRNTIYQQIKTEVDRLNKIYPDQKYYPHDVNFLYENAPVPMQNNVMMAKTGDRMGGRNVDLAVGDKLRLSAVVELASNPDPSLLKLH